MKNIAIVQGHKKQCGVYQYGLSTYKILEKSKKYNYLFAPVNGIDEFIQWVNIHRPDAIIFNYDSSLLNWFSDHLANHLPCVKFLTIGHEPTFLPNFQSAAANFLISPNIKPFNDKCVNIPRPVVEIDDIKYSPPNGPIKIGNFGFGWYTKEYAKIINHVNNQFKDEHVILNFNIGLGDYVDITGTAARKLADECRSVANPNIELNIYHDFLDIEHLILFLNKNDINIFYYAQNNNDGLVSSSTDYALAAKKPIAVNSSSMFKHILSDRIDIDKTPIKDIIGYGLEPISAYQQICTEDNFRKCYEDVISKFL
jgi:hypothetical protein